MTITPNPIEIDVSFEEILDDLLYPERSSALARPVVESREERR